MDNITVLITTRNRPDLLHVAITSVVSAFGAGTKMLIGDNGNPELTSKLLLDNNGYGLQIEHIVNPAGSSYFYNLQKLIDSTTTDWLTLLHDDDFYLEKCGEIIEPYLKNETIDFIFSDHWVCSNDGEILPEQTEANSANYGRDKIPTGLINDLTVFAINKSICLDAFFVRTKLAQKVRVNMHNMPADYRWMIELCEGANKAQFISDRLFVYRLNAVSATALGLLNENKTLQCLIDSKPAMKKERSQSMLKKAILNQTYKAFKYSVKRWQLIDFFKTVFGASKTPSIN